MSTLEEIVARAELGLGTMKIGGEREALRDIIEICKSHRLRRINARIAKLKADLEGKGVDITALYQVLNARTQQ